MDKFRRELIRMGILTRKNHSQFLTPRDFYGFVIFLRIFFPNTNKVGCP